MKHECHWEQKSNKSINTLHNQILLSGALQNLWTTGRRARL